jgi:hypothetical protein
VRSGRTFGFQYSLKQRSIYVHHRVRCSVYQRINSMYLAALSPRACLVACFRGPRSVKQTPNTSEKSSSVTAGFAIPFLGEYVVHIFSLTSLVLQFSLKYLQLYKNTPISCVPEIFRSCQICCSFPLPVFHLTISLHHVPRLSKQRSSGQDRSQQYFLH